jgi:hypothetical protein
VLALDGRFLLPLVGVLHHPAAVLAACLVFL